MIAYLWLSCLSWSSLETPQAWLGLIQIRLDPPLPFDLKPQPAFQVNKTFFELYLCLEINGGQVGVKGDLGRVEVDGGLEVVDGGREVPLLVGIVARLLLLLSLFLAAHPDVELDDLRRFEVRLNCRLRRLTRLQLNVRILVENDFNFFRGCSLKFYFRDSRSFRKAQNSLDLSGRRSVLEMCELPNRRIIYTWGEKFNCSCVM